MRGERAGLFWKLRSPEPGSRMRTSLKAQRLTTSRKHLGKTLLYVKVVQSKGSTSTMQFQTSEARSILHAARLAAQKLRAHLPHLQNPER